MHYGAGAEKEEIPSTIYSRLDASRAIIAQFRERETKEKTSLASGRKILLATILLLFVRLVQSIFIELMN